MTTSLEPHHKPMATMNEMTPDQLKLIKSTVAKGATDDELSLFLYRCKNMGLDPLKPGQIHFVKYGSSPGTIVVGIEGFRLRAASTGKHTGTKRGAMRDTAGKCIGAWCEVYRSDWNHPAREETPLREYNTGKNNWLKMPETMIKKVCEVAALRMAFPDELGGIYSDDEMDQAEPKTIEPKTIPNVAPKPTVQPQEPRPVTPPAHAPMSQPDPSFSTTPVNAHEQLKKIAPESDPGKYVFPFKKYKGLLFEEIGGDKLQEYMDIMTDIALKDQKPISPSCQKLFGMIQEYHEQIAFTLPNESSEEFMAEEIPF